MLTSNFKSSSPNFRFFHEKYLSCHHLGKKDHQQRVHPLRMVTFTKSPVSKNEELHEQEAFKINACTVLVNPGSGKVTSNCWGGEIAANPRLNLQPVAAMWFTTKCLHSLYVFFFRMVVYTFHGVNFKHQTTLWKKYIMSQCQYHRYVCSVLVQ